MTEHRNLKSRKSVTTTKRVENEDPIPTQVQFYNGKLLFHIVEAHSLWPNNAKDARTAPFRPAAKGENLLEFS